MGNVLRGFAWCLLGCPACGWILNRLAAYLVDNPLTLDSNHDLEGVMTAFSLPPTLDARQVPMYAFWAGVAVVAFSMLAKYDWTGAKAEARELKGQEYGDARWATQDEMDQFAHTSLVRRCAIRVPQRFRSKVSFARRNPRLFLMSKLGMREKKADPKPAYVERLEDDNIILSERAELQLSKIPDPILERNKHVYVLGGSGSGKTFNYVGPNLLQLNSSYVVTDPKGDTLKQYGNFFLSHGYKLKVVNTKADQISMSMRYNPIHYLQNSTSIMQIVTLLIDNTSGDKESSSSNQDFFVKAESQLYMCLIGYLFYFYEGQPQYQTLPQMLDLLQLAGKADPSQTKTPLDVIMLGGSLRKSHRYTAGPLALRALEVLHPDKAFVSPTSYVPGRGLMTNNQDMAELKRAFLACAERTYVLLDSSKVGAPGLLWFGTLADVEALITNEDPGEAVSADGEELGCRIIY